MNASVIYHATSDDLQSIYQASVEGGEDRTVIQGKDFSNQEIALSTLQCTDFVNTDFTNTVIKGCDLRGAAFDKAVLDHTRFIDCCVGDCSFPEQALVPGNKMLEFDNCRFNVVGTA